MNIVFAGTPEFAVPCLLAAAKYNEVLAVYTQPDRPAGRGRGMTASAVKQQAQALNIPVYQPPSLKTEQAQQQLRDLKPDILIVVAYGLILPQAILDIPTYGCWNIHASLLPRWRGAAPIHRAIEAGDTETSACLMQMDAGLDTGPILLSQYIPIHDTETSGQLHDRLANVGAQVLSDGLGLLRVGIIPQPQPQSSQGITYAHKLEKSEAKLDWTQTAQQLERRIRAFQPWPIAETTIAGERTRIHQATAIDQPHNATPGTLLAATREGIDIACQQGILRLLQLQRDGGRNISAADYLNARRDALHV